MRILAYTSPARGHLFPLVPVLDELAGRGHEIAIRTLASEVSMLRERGFEAAPIASVIETIEPDDYLGRTVPGKLKRSMAMFAARSPHEIEDLRGAIDEHRPDALLIDCMTWGAWAVAESSDRPWAQWFPYPMPLASRAAPPYGPGFAPAAGPLGRLRDGVFGPLSRRTLESTTLPGVNAVRSRVGVDALAGAEELFTSPPLVLYMTGEPFEYPHPEWPDSIVSVGPCPWDPPSHAPAWVEQIEDPIVLVSTSSEFQDDGRLVTTALEAFAHEPVQIVATLPSAGLPESVPPNARVERFIPHAPILARAACAVTHGGAGATQKALANGVPVCVVPFGRDQMEVARRVEVADAGTRLSSRRLEPGRLRDAVRRAMGMGDGARRVAAGFEATGGARTAADAFEALARGRASLQPAGAVLTGRSGGPRPRDV